MHELSPVTTSAANKEGPQQSIGLCLSGGGYRAMLFHLGVLWRLAEFGYLSSKERQGKQGAIGSLHRVSSVSGGSITAAVLGLAWEELRVNEEGVSERFEALVAEPIQTFASQSSVTFWTGLAPALINRLNARLVRKYRKKLYGDRTLQDLPKAPRFIINATNLQSGELWQFSRKQTEDRRVGVIRQPHDSIAKAVGASSAFPPFLSPARFVYNEADYEPDSGEDLQMPPFTTKPQLSDGGVYDNLGLETIFNHCQTIIASNAGGKYQAKKLVHKDWVRQTYRVVVTIDNQVRTLRKELLLDALRNEKRYGSYWSIRGDIRDYPAADKLDCPLHRTRELAEIRTDLEKKSQMLQRRLVNWGYAICDAGIRSWLENSLPAPDDFPYPKEGV